MKSKLFTLPRLIILLLIIMVSIICMWLGLRALLVNKIVGSIKNYQSQGYQINHGGLSITGFPFNIITNSKNIAVRAPNSESIKLGQLNLSASVFKPLIWNLKHQGEMRIDVRGSMGERYLFDVIPARLSADATLGFSGELSSANFHINSPVQFQSLVGMPPPIRSIKSLDARFSKAGTAGKVKISAQNIVLSGQAAILHQTFGTQIKRIDMEVMITAWPIFEKRGGLAWQQNGGKIISDAFNVKWGPLDMIGDFNIRFENSLPGGTLRIRIKDAKTLLDQLIAANLVSKKFSSQAHMLVGLIKTDEDNRQELVFTVNKGVVKYGFFTIYKY